MSSTSNRFVFFRPIKSSYPKAIYLVFVPSIVLLILVALISHAWEIPISQFTRDPLAITGGHPALGLVSNIGCILWSFSVAICFFSFFVAKAKPLKSLDIANFFLLGGIISSLLLADDLFMLHEKFYVRILLIDERLVYAFYGAIGLYYILKYKKFVLTTDYKLLMLMSCFFIISILVDMLPKTLLPMHHLFEDGSKFLGIVSWFGYIFSSCYQYFTAPEQMDHA